MPWETTMLTPLPSSLRRRLLRRSLVLFAATAVGAGVVQAPPAVASHTATPTRVTLMGDLMSELGCDADWDESCGVTDLARSGDTTRYSGVFQVPGGAYEFKVRINGSWDENYGAGGAAGGANIPLVLQAPAKLRFTYDHATHQVSAAPAERPPGLTRVDRRLAQRSLREDLTRERFYFVMADRFSNGRKANDRGGLPADRLVSGYDPTHKGFYHGGDLRGIIKRLDYIKGMGTTAIWLTPSFKNKPVQGTGDNVSAGYHGYWITDFTQIDPHLGTNADLEELVDKAHARGMKVFFDIITNHTADVIDYAEGKYDYITKEEEPYRDAEGKVFDDRDYAGTERFPRLDPETSFPYTPVFPRAEDRTVKVPKWLNDRRLYHNRGNAEFTGNESDVYGDFFGLDDLFTEHPDVVDGMKDIYKAWVDFGIDGFRIDTVKHVNMEFWQDFAPAIERRAATIGNDDFFSFGEVFDANPANTSRFTTEGRLQATLDFPFQAVAQGFGNGKATTELRDLFAKDDLYIDRDSNAYSLPTFLGNHDMGRIGRFLAEGGAKGRELVQRDRLVHSLMYLTRGQPVVYYGDEQGFTGDGGDQDARQDMFPSKVATYNDDNLIGTDATTAEANFDTRHPLYQHLRKLSALRERHPTLADGTQIHRYASNRTGVYAFSRVSDRNDVEYVVAVNNSESRRRVSFPTLSKGMTFTGVWPSTRSSVRSDRERRVTVTVPPLSAVVYRATKATAPSKAAPKPTFRTAAGSVVADRAEVGVVVPGKGLNHVTFAWRPVGRSTWRVLGTDDNAPYRVFHDVRGLAKGTLVEYRAIVRDHSGNLAVNSTYGVVGEVPAATGGVPLGDPGNQPDSVAVPGDLNSEMGCPGDWQPDCAKAQLTPDEDDQIWKGTYTLPAGAYAYKAAINRSWDENYGAGAARNGGNIGVESTGKPITFYYDHATHWVTSDANGPIVTAPGSFQSELGCPGDHQPGCMRPWLQDPDGDGVFTWLTERIPAGTWTVKVAHGLSWDENYGEGGQRNGQDISFTVPAAGLQTLFVYDSRTHVLTVTSAERDPEPDLGRRDAQWLTPAVVAWNVDHQRGRTYRLHFSRTGRLAPDAETLGGFSVQLTRSRLSDQLRARFPELAAYDALVLDAADGRDLSRLRQPLTGQFAVAQYDDLGRLVDATGVEVREGVLDAFDRR
ncbi:MAG: alpha-amylase family glycosyl hydrolase [Actinomycetota bacterium]|nr:alpha-amylase family glycosyl hydrolase [Actinomycetota bacterium]